MQVFGSGVDLVHGYSYSACMRKLFRKLTDGEGFYFEFFRYAVVGFTTTIVDFTILFSLTEFAKIYYLYSAAIAFLFGLVISYLLSVNWAFKKRSIKNVKVEFIIYCLIGVAGLALTEMGLWFFTERLHIYYMFSKVMAATIVYLWNFFMRKYVLFGNK